MRIVIYTRISRDDKNDEAGVQRQEADCRKWAEDHGYEVVEVFCDNDISAMGYKHRPDYLRMLAGIKLRAFDAVVTWHQDRITRSPKEMEEYILTCGERNGMPTYTLNGGPLNLETPEGRMWARFGVIIAQYYVEHNRLNNLRAKKSKRDRGLYQGIPGLGWRWANGGNGRDGKIEQVPEEAKVIRRMYLDFAGKKTARQIAKMVNAEGYRTRNGSKFTADTVMRTLRSPTHAGLIETNRPKPFHYRKPHGELSDGSWEPIIDRGTWEFVVTLVRDPNSMAEGSPPGKNLLNRGIAVCAKCGGRLSVTQMERLDKDGNKIPAPYYRCADRCVWFRLSLAEEYVIAEVLNKLTNSESVIQARDLDQEIAAVRAKQAELADYYANSDDMTYHQFANVAARLREREETANMKRRLLKTGSDVGTRKWWDRQDLDTQRTLIRGLTKSITLDGLHGRPRNTPMRQRIAIEWR